MAVNGGYYIQPSSDTNYSLAVTNSTEGSELVWARTNPSDLKQIWSIFIKGQELEIQRDFSDAYILMNWASGFCMTIEPFGSVGSRLKQQLLLDRGSQFFRLVDFGSGRYTIVTPGFTRAVTINLDNKDVELPALDFMQDQSVNLMPVTTGALV